MQRHIYYYTHLLAQPGVCGAETRFRDDPASWLPPPAQLTDAGWLVDLHADGVLVPPLALLRSEVQLSPVAVPGADGLIRAVSWHSARADRLFPVFGGELQLTSLPASGWQLSLTGTYRPPLSVVGGAADRVLGHRVAEACVRRFVLDIAERLTFVEIAV